MKAEKLKELLEYNPDTGVFTWTVSRQGTAGIGSAAGSLRPDGYITIMVDGKLYKAHRLAFLYMEGYMPEHDVDHKNGNRDDKRWGNLRHVTRTCNLQNCKVSSRNKSRFLGVSWHKQKPKMAGFSKAK